MHRKHLMFRVDIMRRYRGMVQLFFPRSPVTEYIKHGGTHKEKIDKGLMFQQLTGVPFLKHMHLKYQTHKPTNNLSITNEL